MNLVIGGRGMVGSALVRKLQEDCQPVIFTGSDEFPLDQPWRFISNEFSHLSRVFFCASPTNVDSYEYTDSEAAYNATVSTAKILQILQNNNPKAHFVFVSSSYVFGETPRPAKTTDKRNPFNTYGVCKAVMEDYVLNSGGSVVRTSGVFGLDYRRSNFVDRIVDAERVAPIFGQEEIQNWTLSDYLADRMIHLWEEGVYHIAGPSASRQEMARKVVRRMVECGQDAPTLTLLERPVHSAVRPFCCMLATKHEMTIEEMLEQYIV